MMMTKTLTEKASLLPIPMATTGCLAASPPSRSVPTVELRSVLIAVSNAAGIHSVNFATIITSRLRA